MCYEPDLAREHALQARERGESIERASYMLGHKLYWHNGVAVRTETTKRGDPVWLTPWSGGPLLHRRVVGGERPTFTPEG